METTNEFFTRMGVEVSQSGHPKRLIQHSRHAVLEIAEEGLHGSQPCVARTGLVAARLRISAKSRLGEKLAYIHRHWDGLQTFLTDGRVEIDSNKVENLVRPIALNRKNALFAGHDEGGKAWGRIASLIETAKINDIEPFAYLTSTLEAIAAGHPQHRIDELLPWNFQPSSRNPVPFSRRLPEISCS